MFLTKKYFKLYTIQNINYKIQNCCTCFITFFLKLRNITYLTSHIFHIIEILLHKKKLYNKLEYNNSYIQIILLHIRFNKISL